MLDVDSLRSDNQLQFLSHVPVEVVIRESISRKAWHGKSCRKDRRALGKFYRDYLALIVVSLCRKCI